MAMKTLSEKEWNSVAIQGLFKFVRGRENNMAALGEGNTPLISAKANSNGLKCFVTTPKTIVSGGCITLNNDGDGGAGLAYYQPFDMALDSHVTALLPEFNMSDVAMLFISESLSGLHGFFGHGLSIANNRVKNIRVMLPVTEDGEPDYAYMEQYASSMRERMLDKYRAFLDDKLSKLEYKDIPALSEKKWGAFSIADMFSRIVSGKVSNASAFEKTADVGIEYVAATNRNNGCLYYLKNSDGLRRKIQPGNCIGFIKDGDGSAGFAIYKSESFVSTVNVIYGYADWLNCYTGLFFVAAQDMIKKKYSHGYKRNQQHLRGDKVMLPVTDTGEPDYDYMEQYVKNMMLKKYKQYLAYLEG